jgi:hypothetical protein
MPTSSALARPGVPSGSGCRPTWVKVLCSWAAAVIDGRPVRRVMRHSFRFGQPILWPSRGRRFEVARQHVAVTPR